jgi:Gpi18-like mannosyltransferase
MKFFNELKHKLTLLGTIIVFIFLSYYVFLFNTKFMPKNKICYHILLQDIYSTQNTLTLNTNWKTHEQIVDIYKQLCENKGKKDIYKLIQQRYWNVSFMSQYNLNNIDRFILALPILSIALLLIINLLKRYRFKSLVHEFNLTKFFNIEIESVSSVDKEKTLKKQIEKEAFYFSSLINFIANFLILLFFAHPQISNRVLTSSPLLYIYCSDEVIKFVNLKRFYLKGFSTICVFLVVSGIGCIMYTGSYGFA